MPTSRDRALDRALQRARGIALGLPGCAEAAGTDGPLFAIGGAALCTLHDARPDGGRVSLQCASPPGVPEEMVGAEPSRFFHPTDAEGQTTGWLGVHLDGSGDDAVDWDEIAAILDDALLTVTGASGEGADAIDTGEPGRYRFTARLWLHNGGSWYFATVPPTISAAIDQVLEAERRGFGSRRVEVTIGATTWSTSVFPDASAKTYVLPVKKAVRTAERLGEGDDADVTIQLVGMP